jgi:hypothetical protein
LADDLNLSLVKIFYEELLVLNNDLNSYFKILLSKKRKLLLIKEIAKIFSRNFLPPSKHVHILIKI